MVYNLTGACPRCGAPIYEVAERGAYENEVVLSVAPTAHFTCECRKTLPEPLPDLGEDVSESVDDADRKHLARTRSTEEGASEERADA